MRVGDGTPGPGAPTGYRAEYCDDVIAWGRQGKSRAWIAATIGVVRNTLKNWEANFPEFAEAMALAHDLSQKWWEDAGQEGIADNRFNGGVYNRSMAARFPDDWRESKVIDANVVSESYEERLKRLG